VVKIAPFLQSALYILHQEESRVGHIKPGFLLLPLHIVVPIAPPHFFHSSTRR